MYNIDLKKVSSKQLRILSDRIQQEAQSRLEGEKVDVWKVSVNGGVSWYKDYRLFSDYIKELAEDYLENDNMLIVIDRQLKPKAEVDTWDGDYYYED